ncbi:hypothetical protein SASPL_121336 [Salvia splendens]|uniref:Terpene synthase metal-binding domain-containing protein n=1 Tax=Salvia splendens TaxID=180675 RepID=A0A8X8XS76_SALSN|nr:hypothetical protein SASPL_121336 [Salvia splendens]
MHDNNNSVIHRLAGLSFNTIQVQHQNDLKDIIRWWRNVGLLEVLTFSRDRVVESFLWAVGVATNLSMEALGNGSQKPSSARSLEEMLLDDTANDMDLEIQKEKGWTSVLPHLKKVWIGFCKALLVEAKWVWNGESPSLVKYVENGWISSSGPVLSLHALLGAGHDMESPPSITTKK